MDTLANGGTIVLSFLNGREFINFAEDVYETLQPIVGQIDYDLSFTSHKNTFRTSKGYFSKWYESKEVDDKFKSRNIQVDPIKLKKKIKNKIEFLDLAYVYTITPKR